MPQDWKRSVAVGIVLVHLHACGDTDGRPTAYAASYTTLEEAPVAGVLQGFEPQRQRITFAVGTPPSHGSVRLDSSTGRFVYEPAVDFYGDDVFTFTVTDGESWSVPATVSLTVENTNDAPTIGAIPTMRNSAKTEFVEYRVDVIDPDPERPYVSVSVQDQEIVEASIDQDGILSLKALGLGTTTVTVEADDDEFNASFAFEFVAEEVAKTLTLAVPNTDQGMIRLRNVNDKPVDFTLIHNGFPTFETIDDVVAHVEALPERIPGEPFERKLWRFLRDSTYHDVPLSERRWANDPWVTLNSLGWGFCSSVAAAYVEIARAAGYQARAWGLDGHAVPEIMIDGRWQMYDPDLSVYYWTDDLRVAGVEELASNPALITEPIRPIFEGSQYQLPYTQYIADIYSSTADNLVSEWWVTHNTPSSRIVLPDGARLTYPGKWTDVPTGYDGSATRHFRQALLELRDGWTGTLSLPWMVWEVRGSGQVGVRGTMYDVDSPELTERIRNANQPITSLEVFSSGTLQVIFFVNAVRYDVKAKNVLEFRGLDVWAVESNTMTLGDDQAVGATLPGVLSKPLPTVVP